MRQRFVMQEYCRSRLSKASLFQAFEHLVACLLRAELPGEPFRVEKRRQAYRCGTLTLGVLGSVQLRLGSGQDGSPQ